MNTLRIGLVIKKSIVACLLTSIIILSGCGGMGDWAYDELPLDYSIWCLNAYDIRLVRSDGNHGETVVDQFIIAFCYNSRYIGLKRIVMEESYTLPESMETLDISQPEFYLIDTAIDSVSGPLSEEEYEAITSQIADMCEWISTETPPSGAY